MPEDSQDEPAPATGFFRSSTTRLWLSTAAILARLGAGGHLPAVPESTLPDLAEVLAARRRVDDVPIAAALSKMSVLHWLFFDTPGGDSRAIAPAVVNGSRPR